MRILHVVPTYIPAWRYGGPIRSVHGLCKGLAARGHDVHVFTTNVDGDGRTPAPRREPVPLDDVKVWYFDVPMLRRLYFSPGMWLALRHDLASFDLVHLHSVFLWPTLCAARVARRSLVPYVVSPRGMLVQEFINRRSRFVKTAWISLFERKTLRQAAAVHFTTKSEMEKACTITPDMKHIFVVPNGVDSPAVTSGTASARRWDPYVVYVGRLSWEKGLDRLLHAMASVPNCNLVIVGEGDARYKRELLDIISSNGTADRIFFLGALDGDEKDDVIGGALLLVLPSYSENFGNVVLEAMALGCPVLVTRDVGAAELVEAHDAGVVAEGSVEGLVEGMLQLLSDRGLALEMGRNGRKAISEHFSWGAIARRFEKEYLSLLPQTAFSAHGT